MAQERRYSISVAGPTYDRLVDMSQEAPSLQRFVDRLIVSSLEDPTIRARVVARCRAAAAR